MPKTLEMSSLRDDIKTLRKQLQLTQEEAAHLLGVTVTTLSRWTNGRTEDPDPIHREKTQIFLSLLKEANEAIKPGGIAWWFRTPHPYLSDLSPLDLMRSSSGIDKVRSLLGSMRWGLPA
jgi:transcriptional regulator with XRE-family HTH domain